KVRGAPALIHKEELAPHARSGSFPWERAAHEACRPCRHTASCCFPWDSHGSLPVLLISGTPKPSSDAVLRAGVVATGRTSSSDSDFDNLSGTVVELRGFEPLASSLRTRRSPN